VSKLVRAHGDRETAAAGARANGGAKQTKLPRRRNPAREMTANEATLRAWKKTYENRHRKDKATAR
jgi:hypothetical protein